MPRQPFVEFSGNKRLLWIAEEWIRYAPRLAEWAMERLVNRRDVWSQYTIKNDRISVVMLPIKERRKPNQFQPKREVEPDDLPYTMRLPGRHHTRPHYTRVYNFDFADEPEWLEGGEAIELMLAARTAPLPKLKKKKESNKDLRPV